MQTFNVGQSRFDGERDDESAGADADDRGGGGQELVADALDRVVEHSGVFETILEAAFGDVGRLVAVREHRYHVPGAACRGVRGKGERTVRYRGDDGVVAEQVADAAVRREPGENLDIGDGMVDPTAECTIDVERPRTL